jgi:hypothetical protein
MIERLRFVRWRGQIAVRNDNSFRCPSHVLSYRPMKTRPFDAHDDQERGEIRAILEELPKDHAAWTALEEGADAVRLTHLVDGRKDLIDRLTQAWLGGYGRMMRRSAHFRP